MFLPVNDAGSCPPAKASPHKVNTGGIETAPLARETLARAIDRAVGSNELRPKAMKMGERIRVEDAVTRAVEIIEASAHERGITINETATA